MNAPWSAADERALVRRCQTGDRSARRELVVRHERAVFALLSRLTGHGPHVEDLAQETFLRAFSALDGFDPDGPARLSTWLLTIATRLGLDARKRRVLPTGPLEPELPASDGDDPEQQADRARLGRAIAAAAAQLGDDQRAAFVLLDFHGLSVAEVAHATGVPENTVKQRAFRAREKLRSLLAALRPAPPTLPLVRRGGGGEGNDASVPRRGSHRPGETDAVSLSSPSSPDEGKGGRGSKGDPP